MTKHTKPGDIVLVKGTSIFSKIVRWVTRINDEPKTYASHSAIISVGNEIYNSKIIEALIHVKETNLNRYKNKHFEIWRLNTISSEDRDNIVKQAGDYLSYKYGFLKILYQFLDYIIIKVINKEIFLFRRLAYSDKYPICSWLVAWAYYDSIMYDFGIDPKFATPDDIHDYIKNHDDWDLIFKE